MTIAILAWGSLIWSPGTLHIEGGWTPGGPTLPIEFSRISNNGRLTLVIDEQAGVPVPTRYALSSFTSTDAAVRDLQLREGAPAAKGIGFIDRAAGRSSTHVHDNHPDAWARIEQWAHQNDIGTVIWTAIGPRFKDKTGTPFSLEAAISYLASLPETVRAVALETSAMRRRRW